MTNENRPWEKVSDPSYFRAVMRNFVAIGYGPSKDGMATVRFGRTGDGVHPNYQIEAGDGEPRCFRGSNHKEADDLVDAFDPDKISEAFSYSHVAAMLERRI